MHAKRTLTRGCFRLDPCQSTWKDSLSCICTTRKPRRTSPPLRSTSFVGSTIATPRCLHSRNALVSELPERLWQSSTARVGTPATCGRRRAAEKQGRDGRTLLLQVHYLGLPHTSRANKARTKISMTGPFDCSLAHPGPMYSPGANSLLHERMTRKTHRRQVRAVSLVEQENSRGLTGN